MKTIVLIVMAGAAALLAQDPQLKSYLLSDAIHGLDYSYVHSFPPSERQWIATALRDPSYSRYAGNLALALGIISKEDASREILELFKQGSNTQNSLQYINKKNALLALGYVANTTHSKVAVRYLSDALDPSFWRHSIEWGVEGYTRDQRDIDLSCVAAFALAISGQESASAALRKAVATRANAPALASALGQAVKEAARVRQVGLERYYQTPQ